MKTDFLNIKWGIVFLLFMACSFNNLQGQSFEQLFDYSGDNSYSENETALKSAADSLVAAFPTEFQEQFKVYDFGFYLHQESYDDGGYPDKFVEVVRELESPYYLVFGRQTDGSGVNSKVWVEFSMTTPDSSCFNGDLIQTLLVQEQNKLTGTPAYSMEIQLMEKLAEMIKASSCCLEPSRNSCGYDIDRVDQIVSMFGSSSILVDMFAMYGRIKSDIECITLGDLTPYHEDGIIPKCFWIDWESSGNPLEVNRPRVSGFYDGQASNILDLIEFAELLHWLSVELKYFIYQRMMELAACGWDPQFHIRETSEDPVHSVPGATSQDLDESLRRLYHNDQNWESAAHWQQFRQDVEDMDLLDGSFMGYTVECADVYRNQLTLVTLFNYVTNKEVIATAFDEAIVWVEEFFYDLTANNNVGIYLRSFYTQKAMFVVFEEVAAAQFLSRFLKATSKSDFIEDYVNDARKYCEDNSNFKRYVAEGWAGRYLEDFVKHQDWYKNIDEAKKPYFDAEFGSSPIALLNGKKWVGAWGDLFSRNVPRELRINIEVLKTLTAYKNSSIISRVDNWGTEEFIEHFDFVKSNPDSGIKFRNYIDNDVNFLAVSGGELNQFLKIIKVIPSKTEYIGDLYRSLKIDPETGLNAYGNVPGKMTDYTVYSTWGRYDLEGGQNAMYLSKTLGGNETELVVGYNLKWLDYNTYKFSNIEANNILDLSDATVRSKIAVDFAMLTKVSNDKADMYEFTNVIADWARKNGFEGISAPGARGNKDYDNVVLFDQDYINDIFSGISPELIPK